MVAEIVKIVKKCSGTTPMRKADVVALLRTYITADILKIAIILSALDDNNMLIGIQSIILLCLKY